MKKSQKPLRKHSGGSSRSNEQERRFDQPGPPVNSARLETDKADSPQLTQASSSNPGWRGPGLEPLPARIRWTISRARAYAQRREWGELRHMLAAEAINVWNLHGPRSRDRVHCPCCEWRGPAFLAYSNWRAVSMQAGCPNCDSRSRHRGLVGLMRELAGRAPAGNALVFAPEGVILAQLKRHWPAERIRTTDYRSWDVDLPGLDIQRLAIGSGEYSLLICNHVLEHVDDDEAAMDECSRVLRTRGVAIFTVPGDFPARATWKFSAADQNGHLRHYGMDIVEKLRGHFARVEAVDMSRSAPPEWRVRKHDYAFVCLR